MQFNSRVLQRALVSVTPTIGLVGGLLLPAGEAEASTVRANVVIEQLAVKEETTSPAYNREAFKHWVDEDRNGCDTRAEVLIRDSRSAVTFSNGCTVASGK